MSRLKYLFLSIVFVFFSSVIIAQTNPGVVDISTTYNGYESVLIESTINPTVLYSQEMLDDPTWGDFDWTNVADDVYSFNYMAPANDVDIYVPVEYYVPGPFNFIPKPQYMQIHIVVENSTIDANADYVMGNGPVISIDIISNDYSSDGSVYSSAVLLNQDITSDIDSMGSLNVYPLSNDSKMYAQYLVEDTLGSYSVGKVVIIPPAVNLSDEVNTYFTTNKKTLEFTLPDGGFAVNGDYGQVAGVINDLNDFTFSYTPDENFSGMDSVQFVNSDGITYTSFIKVYDVNYNNTSVRDDIVYTAENASITFNVYDNDIKQFNISGYSEELTYNGDGEFTYVPEDDYSGVQNFYYATYNGLETSTADIKIIVSDQAPINHYQYTFNAIYERPRVIEYLTPLEGESIQIVEYPTFGDLVILDEQGEVLDSCNSITGKNKIVYIPPSGFANYDYFKIEYCPTEGNCYVLDNKMHVLPFKGDDDCICVDDCVWEGDANNDGRVSLLDLLALGDNFGSVLEARDDIDFGGPWFGQSSDNFDFAKYSDADGDGIVTENDVAAISDNYGKEHSYNQYEELIPADFAVILDPQVSSVDSGDLLRIDIIVGNEAFPAIDVHGVSFAMNFSPSFADSASMNVIYNNASWLNHNDPSISLSTVPYDGRIESVITRTTGATVSGEGIIAVAEFIVEEEGEGFRGTEGEKYIDVLISDIVVSDVNGNLRKLPDTATQVLFGKKEDETQVIDDKDDMLYVYPNPTNGDLNVFLNGDKNIQSLQLVNTSGITMLSRDNIDLSNTNIDISSLTQGFYFLQVVTDTESYTQKVQLAFSK